MCRRKKKDNPWTTIQGRPNKDFSDVTRAPPCQYSCCFNNDPSSDAESQADSVESAPVIDCRDKEEIGAGYYFLKNRAIVEANNDFATTLMKEFFGCESVCMSPISITFVLAMSLAGTKGETEKEIKNLLGKGCSLDEIEAYFVDVKTVFRELSELEIIHVANRIYYAQSIELLETYKEKVTELYGEDGFDFLDFSDSDDGTAKKINAFVVEKTKGNLGNVISVVQISGNQMILLSDLDFRGKWERPFSPMLNEIKNFHLLNGTTKKTEMMRCDSFPYVIASDYFYCENDEMKRICLRYKNEKNSSYTTNVGEISMYIFLPRARKGLPKLVKNLNGEKLLKWLRMKPLENYYEKDCEIMHTLSILIPKFTIRTDAQLSDALENIGLEHYFSENANFSRASNAALHANSFIHMTSVKADELGTEASASSKGKLKGRTYNLKGSWSRRNFTQIDHFCMQLYRENNTCFSLEP